MAGIYYETLPESLAVPVGISKVLPRPYRIRAPRAQSAVLGGLLQQLHQRCEEAVHFLVVRLGPDHVLRHTHLEQVVAAAQQQAAQTSAFAPVVTLGGGDSSNPNAPPAVLGNDMGGGYYNCKPDDHSPSGTIVNGYKKTSAQSLMGATCRWEKVQ